MANILNAIASTLEDLSATHYVCSSFGDTFDETNLFLGFEMDADIDTVTLIPYGGGASDPDGYRQNPSVQVRLRTTSRYKALDTQQALINYLHMNQLNGKGVMYANQSNPLLLGAQDGGEWVISTSNYIIKHVKL